jgi:hypothetical protein
LIWAIKSFAILPSQLLTAFSTWQLAFSHHGAGMAKC